MRDRRRRLLPEDAAISATATVVRVADMAERQQLYADPARAARQRGLHTLVPLRGWTLASVIVGMLASLGGLIGLHLAADRFQPVLGSAAAAGLRLDSTPSLASWFAASLLAVSAALCLFIFSLRRHRIDDYHGRYRMWIYVALACWLGHLVESTSLGAVAAELCRQACAASGLRSELVWPLGVASLVAALILRLAIELRRALAALAMLAIAGVAFLIAASARFAWPVAHSPQVVHLWFRGSWVLGYVFLLVALLLYSRRVQFDVAGAAALPARAKRKKKAASADDADAAPQRPTRKSNLKLRTDLDPVERSTPEADEEEPQPTSSPKLAQGTKSTEAASSQGASGKRPSRAERRKLRQDQHRLAS